MVCPVEATGVQCNRSEFVGSNWKSFLQFSLQFLVLSWLAKVFTTLYFLCLSSNIVQYWLSLIYVPLQFVTNFSVFLAILHIAYVCQFREIYFIHCWYIYSCLVDFCIYSNLQFIIPKLFLNTGKANAPMYITVFNLFSPVISWRFSSISRYQQKNKAIYRRTIRIMCEILNSMNFCSSLADNWPGSSWVIWYSPLILFVTFQL